MVLQMQSQYIYHGCACHPETMTRSAITYTCVQGMVICMEVAGMVMAAKHVHVCEWLNPKCIILDPSVMCTDPMA